MDGNVIKLDDHRKARQEAALQRALQDDTVLDPVKDGYGVYHPMPRIFRHTGYVEKEASKQRDDKRRRPWVDKVTLYALTSKNKVHLHVSKSKEIGKLTPKADKGWLIIRQHETADALRSYADAYADVQNLYGERFVSTYETSLGFFSLLHRECIRGTPDCLLIYVFRQKNGADSFVIRHPNGKTTYDPSLIFPHMRE